MTLKIELGPTSEADLRKRAAEAGKDPADFAREVLEENLLSSEASRDEEAAMPSSDRVAEFLKWVQSHRPIGHPVDDSRESIYEGRGE